MIPPHKLIISRIMGLGLRNDWGGMILRGSNLFKCSMHVLTIKEQLRQPDASMLRSSTRATYWQQL
jgi:hypothetical protein